MDRDPGLQANVTRRVAAVVAAGTLAALAIGCGSDKTVEGRPPTPPPSAQADPRTQTAPSTEGSSEVSPSEYDIEASGDSLSSEETNKIAKAADVEKADMPSLFEGLSIFDKTSQSQLDVVRAKDIDPAIPIPAFVSLYLGVKALIGTGGSHALEIPGKDGQDNKQLEFELRNTTDEAYTILFASPGTFSKNNPNDITSRSYPGLTIIEAPGELVVAEDIEDYLIKVSTAIFSATTKIEGVDTAEKMRILRSYRYALLSSVSGLSYDEYLMHLDTANANNAKINPNYIFGILSEEDFTRMSVDIDGILPEGADGSSASAPETIVS